MKALFEQFQKMFTADTTGEGESNKLVVVLREIEFSLMVYAIICGVYSLMAGLYTVAGCFFITLIAYFLLIHASYRIRTRVQLAWFNLVAIVGMVFGVYSLGAEIHLQHHLIVLVVVDFFAEYGHYKRKAIVSTILCGIYIMLHTVTFATTPRIPIPEHNYAVYQIINSLFMFINMGIVSYIYSKDSQSLEGKLLEYNNKLKKQASTDALTGLCNRRTALEFIESLIKEHSNNGFCVCMCDIDFFKKVNDSYGHDIGDKVLNGVATAMVDGFPKDCLTSRWGGEEFLVVFPHMNGDDAKMLLDIMRSKIKALEFSAGEKKFGITVTYGLAEYGFDYDADKLVKQADEKLYMGKQNGRDQVVF